MVDAGELIGRLMPRSSYWKIPLSSVLAFERREHAAREAAALSVQLDELGAPAE